MGLLQDIANPQGGVISGIFNLGSKLIDRLLPDPAQKAQAQLELLKLQQSGELAELAADTELLKGQIEINKIEANSNDFFKSNWRPAIGWVCGIAYFSNYVVAPFFTFFNNVFHGVNSPYPQIDMTTMMPVLLGLLGLGAYRTYDKYVQVKNS